MTRTRSAPSTAAIHGPRWGARASDWAKLVAGFSAPAWEAVADAAGIDVSTRVLDVGCGSGEFCRLAAARGALVSGIDAADGMIEVARRQLPAGDFRIGAIESLPWGDDSFDAVTGFNAFQFAADFVAALAEARRVTRTGGRVAICNWGRPRDCELFAIMAPIRELQPPPPPGSPRPDPPAFGEPGVLEDLARQAGLEPGGSGEVDVPFESPGQEAFVRAMLSSGGVAAAIAYSGEETVREVIGEAAAPFRRPGGSYRIENTFTYVVCTA